MSAGPVPVHPGWRSMADPPSSESTSTLEAAKGKIEARDQWSKKIDFLLACVGFSVGLGNVWRFPFLCYRNGGGAFLVPYFVAVFLGGIPMFFLECSLGQFMSEGGIGPWKIAPLFQGIGYCTAAIIFIMNCQYNIILSWAFYYTFASFTSVLPWSHCANDWNTDHCDVFDGITNASTAAVGNRSVGVMAAVTNNSVLGNITTLGLHSNASVTARRSDPVTEFWELKVLGLSSGLPDMGSIKWDSAGCLLLAWLVVYGCICKGIKSSGKVMYFTAPAPYVFMFILLIRNLTLEGASIGLDYYLNPDWNRLADLQVWVDAGTQVFFSYSIGAGTLTALGSYNKFHHNTFRDSLIFACINSFTSILAGFVIFSVLGFMAHRQGVSVADVAESGPGLAFIAYPEAVAQMPFAPFWSILFFIMIILLGLDSQFVGVEGFITACVDHSPHFLRRGYRKEIFTAGVCFVSFLIGLPMVMEGGMYVFQLFDYYSGSRILLLVATMECLVVSYVYGIDRFTDNLTIMFGFHNRKFISWFKWILRMFWSGLTPLFTTTIFIMGCVSYSELTYTRTTGTYIYPPWAIGIGWSLALVSVVLIPICIVQRILTTPGTLRQRIHHLTKPRLRRHQLLPHQNMSEVILVEDEFSADLGLKVDQVTEKDKFIATPTTPHDVILSTFNADCSTPEDRKSLYENNNA